MCIIMTGYLSINMWMPWLIETLGLANDDSKNETLYFSPPVTCGKLEATAVH